MSKERRMTPRGHARGRIRGSGRNSIGILINIDTNIDFLNSDVLNTEYDNRSGRND